MSKKNKLKIITLGGVDEIGKNMTVIEYEDDIMVVDCGSIFPQDDMLGIDLVIPDISYLKKNQDKIRGLVITHGHEDHIGAVPFVLREIDMPIYGTRLTLALIENKLKEYGLDADMTCIQAGQCIELGCFRVHFIKVGHSIAGAVALAIETPVGTVVMTGDFKVDYTPVDGEVMDLGKFAEFGNKGVLALMSESTNVERPGFTMSEQHVGESFEKYFRTAEGRIIIATFASNIHRIQQIVDLSVRYGRKVALVGRSMINVGTMAMELGYLKIPDGALVDMSQIRDIPLDRMTVITTGSQGEPMSGLSRMAMNEHNRIEIVPGDTVIISASTIPGNERMINNLVNHLYERGANVVYEAMAEVHVSGHACQEELKLIYTLVRPKFFIPVHGERRHLVRHGQLMQSLGLPPERFIQPEIGGVIELTEDSAAITGYVQAGGVLVDGLGVGDIGTAVLRDRKLLSQDGLIMVTLVISKENGSLLSDVDIVSRGFVYVKESEELMEEVRRCVLAVYYAHEPRMGNELNTLRNNIRSALRETLYERTKRSPVILPVIIEIETDKIVAGYEG